MKQLILISSILSFLCVNAYAGENIITKRGYVDAPLGQIHFYKAQPLDKSQITKTPLICFHPNPTSGDYYKDFIVSMAKNRIVFALDTPGYGNSDGPAKKQSMLEISRSLEKGIKSLLDHNGKEIKLFDVMGYHTGVFIAVELAIEHPNLIRKLVLPGIPFYIEPERSEKYDEYAKPKNSPDDKKVLDDLWKFWIENRNPKVKVSRALDHLTDNLKAGENYWWAYHAVFSYEAEKRLPLITQPVLIPNIHGGLAKNSRDAAKMIKNSTVVEIPNLKYGVFDLHTNELAEYIYPFLDQ